MKREKGYDSPLLKIACETPKDVLESILKLLALGGSVGAAGLSKCHPEMLTYLIQRAEFIYSKIGHVINLN